MIGCMGAFLLAGHLAQVKVERKIITERRLAQEREAMIQRRKDKQRAAQAAINKELNVSRPDGP